MTQTLDDVPTVLAKGPISIFESLFESLPMPRDIEVWGASVISKRFGSSSRATRHFDTTTCSQEQNSLKSVDYMYVVVNALFNVMERGRPFHPTKA